MYKHLLLLGLLLCLTATTFAQADDAAVIQVSGKVIIEEDNELIPLPYVSVYIDQSNRGVFTNEDGFFSIVAKAGETMVFSGLGLLDAEYIVPDTLSKERYSLIQIMSRDTIDLPETVIYPWPSREHFAVEFLALDVSDPLVETAEENLSPESMARASGVLMPDGVESSQIYFQQMADDYYSAGQLKPQRIFSPLAWAKFIKALKNGDFKREKK